MKKILGVCLVLAIALSALGVGYALWSDTLTINGTVDTGNVGLEWSIEYAGDDEPTGKDISSVCADIVGKELVIIVNNAYPCVNYTVVAEIHCVGSVPVHLTGIVFSGVPAGVTVTATPDVTGMQLHYCDSVTVTINVHLDNSVDQLAQLSFSASVTAEQWNCACSVTWESDVQITATGAESIYPTLGVSGSTIHLAWVDQRDGGGNREIYYNRSADNGTTWQASDTRISNDPAFSIRADFAVNGDAVYLFWRDDRHGNYEEYFVQSTDGGVSWGPETRLTNDPGLSGCPFPVVNGDTLHLFWRDNRSGTFKIYYKRSVDAGANWSADILLTPDGITAEFPFPAINGQTIHLVWRDNRDGNAEIYYKRSTDGGNSWTSDARLTNDPGESEHPKLVVQDDNLYLVWRDNRDGNYEVYFKKSTDGGQTWSADTRLTNNSGQSLWPVLAVSNHLIHLLWADDRDGTTALYYTFSSDGGNSWRVETRLSDCTVPIYMGAHPIMVTDSYIHVVFNDDRSGENEIYYKRGTIPF